MELKITQKLVDELDKYCKIIASQVTNAGRGSRVALFYAEETLSDVLLKFHRKNLDDNWSEKEMNKNFYFMVCRNTCINSILKQNAKKRQIYQDKNAISLSEPYNGYLLELEDEDGLSKKIESDDKINKQIELLTDTLTNCGWLSEFDVNVFVHYFIEKKSIREYARLNDVASLKVSTSIAKLKNVVRYLYGNSDVNVFNTK